MTQEEIIEGNKLIAEFMGGKYKVSPVTLQTDFDRIYLGEDEAMYFTVPKKSSWNSYQLEYNSSWSWLMPVVEKIEHIKGCEIYIRHTGCEIFSFGKSITKQIGETKIKAVWLAVVDFIKWYNQNNQDTITHHKT